MDPKKSFIKRLFQHTSSVVLALVATLLVFLVLPLMQTLGELVKDTTVTSVDAATIDPPPEVEMAEEEPPEEEPEPEPEPEFEPQTQPLDLGQLELALNPDAGGGAGSFDVASFLKDVVGDAGGSVEDIFSAAQLDQRPRIVFQRQPNYPPDLIKTKQEGVVYVVFQVGTDGRVSDPRVTQSTNPVFDKLATDAVRQWRFEPGTRGGKKVRFKMRIPVTFQLPS